MSNPPAAPALVASDQKLVTVENAVRATMFAMGYTRTYAGVPLAEFKRVLRERLAKL